LFVITGEYPASIAQYLVVTTASTTKYRHTMLTHHARVCIVEEQLAVGRLQLAGYAPTVYRKRDAPG